jgi:hypothetical protein
MWRHGRRLLHTLAAVAMGAAGSVLLWAQMRVGTTDATDVNLVTNNTARVIVSSTGHLLPAVNNTYNLGSSTLQWGSAWLGGNLSVGGNGSITGNLSVSGSTVTLSGIPGGSTATDVLVRTGAGDVQYRAASGLVGTYAWLLGGNSLTSVQTLGTLSSHDLPIITNNTERMRVTATGNVGIGTANPTERLQVSDGNVAITNTDNTARQLRLYEPSGSGTNYTAFVAQAQASNIIYTLPASLTTTNTVATGILQTDGNGNLSWLNPSALGGGAAGWALTGNSGTNPAVNFLGTTDAQPLVIRTNNTERMRVTATGNVGIGTANPTERLQVSDGNVAITNTDNTARQLRLYEPSGAGANFTAFQAQAQASNIIYTLPASLTTTNTVATGILQTDASGNLSWLNPRGGGRHLTDGRQREPVVAESGGAGWRGWRGWLGTDRQ